MKEFSLSPGVVNVSGRGLTKGFCIFKMNAEQRKPLWLVPPSLWFKLSFSQKFTLATGLSLPSRLQPPADRVGPRAVQHAETITREKLEEIALGVPLPLLSGLVQTQQGKFSDAHLLDAILFGSSRLYAADSIWHRHFNLVSATILRPLVVNGLRACLGSCVPTVMLAAGLGLAIDRMLEFVRQKTEDFFSSAGVDDRRMDLGSPRSAFSGHSNGGGGGFTPPPGGGTWNAGGGSSFPGHAAITRTMQTKGNSNSHSRSSYRGFPPHLESVRQGLARLGMTWKGATDLLTGNPIDGVDRDIADWLGLLFAVECNHCLLVRFISEHALMSQVLWANGTQYMAWCPICRSFTKHTVQKVAGIRIV